MPTPIPIIAAISGEKVGTTRTWVKSSNKATPTPRPKSAVMMGSPIATTEPKASSMMMMAARMPIPSLAPGAAAATDEMGAPPSATWKPGRWAACAVLITSWMAPDGRSAVAASNCTTA